MNVAAVEDVGYGMSRGLDRTNSHLDRFSKKMSEMTGERGGFSGKERARRLLGQ